MKIRLVLSIGLSTCLVSGTGQAALQLEGSNASKPNILMVLVDDLGYTDLGLYGGNIDTPNIDDLGRHGVVFSNAHVYPSCGPTRASFITGQDPHRVGLGSQNGVAPPDVPLTRKGYKGSLEGDYAGVASLLKKGGYETYQVGKWHLGHEPHQSPVSLGFDHHFTLLDGAASHYGDMLSVGAIVNPSGKADYTENGKKISTLPDAFYSTQFYTQWLIDALKDRERSDGKPFFAYLAYTAVHDPLHAPENLIDKYLHIFSDGFEKLKDQRVRGLVKEGLIADGLLATRWLTSAASWSELTPVQQEDMIRRMAVYAAMLEYLDTQLGGIFAYLKATGDYDNTLIVVMSDNGAATVPRTFYSNSTQDLAWQDRAYPLEEITNYGKKGSFQTLGTYNAQAVSGPYFGFKTNLHEGGTRVPMIIKPPIADNIYINHDFVHITDLYPTFADYAGVRVGEEQDLLGCSLRQILQGENNSTCHDEFGMAYMGWRSYHQGPWKLIFVSKAFGGTGQYALYNLDDDPGETKDLSLLRLDKVEELSAKWQAFALEQGIAIVPMDKVNSLYDRNANKFFDLYWGE